ncbi:MAG: hypothetical protein JXQ90_23630 [Cyclobacteriaceae bacterium]
MRVRIFTIVIFLAQLGLAQEISIRGGFVQDSLGVGEEIQFWMSATYPIDLEVVLPDSNFKFSPYEFVDKQYLPTNVRSGIAFDSVIYTLQSFEIESVQMLQLPAYALNDADSTVIFSNIDSIYFKVLAPVVTDTTSLVENTAYLEVNRNFNFPMFWLVIGLLVVIAVATFLIFGKKIRRYLKIRRIRQEYETFSNRITQYIRDLKSKPDDQVAEEALVYWKRYLEQLENKPFSKLTTREILNYQYANELIEPLKSIDRLVYGKIDDSEIYKSFQSVEDFTQHRYNTKLDELRYGDK